MKKFAKTVVLGFAAIAGLCLAGCYSFETSEGGVFSYGLGNKDAFLIEYVWDGDEENRRIELPDTAGGVPVTTLGGYTGRGFPCPFRVTLPESYTNCDFITGESGAGDGEVKEIEFTLVIGSNLKKLDSLTDIYYPWQNEDGSYTYYHPVYRYEVTEENKTLYAIGGVLYEKATDKAAEWEHIS